MSFEEVRAEYAVRLLTRSDALHRLPTLTPSATDREASPGTAERDRHTPAELIAETYELALARVNDALNAASREDGRRALPADWIEELLSHAWDITRAVWSPGTPLDRLLDTFVDAYTTLARLSPTPVDTRSRPRRDAG